MVGIFAVADGSTAYPQVFSVPLKSRFHEAGCCRKSAQYDSGVDLEENNFESQQEQLFISDPRINNLPTKFGTAVQKKQEFWTIIFLQMIFKSKRLAHKC